MIKLQNFTLWTINQTSVIILATQAFGKIFLESWSQLTIVLLSQNRTNHKMDYTTEPIVEFTGW